MASLAVSLLVALLVGLTPSIQTPPAATGATGADPLVGLWVAQTTPPPAPQGELTLTRGGSTWRATLGNARASFPRDGNQVRFAFADDADGFRGHVIPSAARDLVVTGFWIQPPAGFGYSFASPLVLKPAGGAKGAKSNAWRGTVVPLEEGFTLYLKIFREPSGRILAAFRNPERNEIGGTTQYRVVREGDSESIEFNAGPDPAKPVLRHVATFLRSPDRIRIPWRDPERMLELSRATPAQAAAFFPRPPGAPPYVYAKPPALADGWSTARAREVGMDEATLAKLVQRLAIADPSIRRPQLIHSILVARRGKLVLEEYFYGFDRERRHDVRSVGKTFGSVLLGAAMRRGAKVGPETPVYDALAAMGPFANPDPRKARITVAHLLTHTSGLACDDNDEKSPGNEETMSSQTGQPDWWKYTLDLPQAHEPGVRYAYCSANSNLVGAVLKTATKTSLPELFDRWVARPLDFGRYYWNLMPTGEGYLGGGAFLRSRNSRRPRPPFRLGSAGGALESDRIERFA